MVVVVPAAAVVVVLQVSAKREVAETKRRPFGARSIVVPGERAWDE